MKTKSKKFNFILAFILASLLLEGCTTIYNPATQKNEVILIDTENEVALGQDIDSQIQRKFKILKDTKKQTRLENIGIKVSDFSDRQDIVYRFKIVEDKEFNAFTVPGGSIYVNSGLMDAANDDELACVLAHEIGHIAARHSIKKLQAAIGYQILMGIALGISGQQQIAQATDIIFNLTSLGYSRQDELLADKLSVKYARKAGFNPYGMITFFRKLKKEAENKGGNLNIELFSSHPNIDQRIRNTEKEISEGHPASCFRKKTWGLI